MTDRLRRRLGPAGLFVIAVLYLCFGSLYVTAERPNQDEGWYLYAARLVGEGQRPYVDFAYVQPPLLPYVYHLLGGDRSVSAGRSVSLLFGLVAVLLVAAAGWRAGPVGGLLAAALLALTPFALSQQSIVKTYALANALVAAGLALAVRNQVVGAALAFALAALTRNSVAVVLPVYWLWLAWRPARRGALPLAVATGVGAVLLGYLPFLLADAAAVRYHVFAHHARNVVGTGPIGSPGTALLAMVMIGQSMVKACPALSVAVLAGLGAWWSARGHEDGSAFGDAIALAGLLALAIALGHFVSAHPYQEYQALALPPACVFAGLCWGDRWRRSADRRSLGALLVTLAGVVPLLALGPSIAELSGNKPGPDGQSDPQGVFGPLRRVAALVREHCAPDEELFTFQSDVAVEAHRRLSPGLTLASFSFVDEPDAERWHMVNARTITATFAASRPAVVVLSPGDLEHLLHGRWTPDDRIVVQDLSPESRAVYEPLITALDRGYRLVGRVERVGQFSETYSVLARRESAP